MPPSRAKRASVAGRRAQLVQYRLEGRSYDSIFEELGYGSASAARRDFNRALEESISAERTTVEVYRETALRRLEKLWLSLQPGIDRGEPRAIEVGGQIISRIVKLLGIEAAMKIEVMTIDAVDAEIQRLREQLAASDREATEAGGVEAPPI